MKTNLIPIVAILAIALNSQAGSIKMPAGSNLTRNAGQSIPLTFTASGWIPGQTCKVWLMNARTWTTEIIAIDQPVVNGVNNLSVEIPWAWDKPGVYLVRVVSFTTVATSTWFLTVRSAVKYPYGGVQWWRGGTTAVTWVTDGFLADSMEISLESETDPDLGCNILNDRYNPEPTLGRYDFTVPNMPPGIYRIYLYGYEIFVEWDEEWDEYYYSAELTQVTRSERIVIQ